MPHQLGTQLLRLAPPRPKNLEERSSAFGSMPLMTDEPMGRADPLRGTPLKDLRVPWRKKPSRGRCDYVRPIDH
ncbi:hypothetical protein Hypma_003623 [Hypsizygus marmoreus]|uniref:Uncharacterized protein n=1 Tax=Hypsizygus marmoreus TaxID=39966 RepID=A0A369J1E3_HYPMA|nr:hypothetical protein Hypma_003623 [Hypsizygus marmoreus]